MQEIQEVQSSPFTATSTAVAWSASMTVRDASKTPKRNPPPANSQALLSPSERGLLIAIMQSEDGLEPEELKALTKPRRFEHLDPRPEAQLHVRLGLLSEWPNRKPNVKVARHGTK